MVKAFDVMKHEHVPKHEVLSESDAQAVLELYGVKPDQLPKILASDPVARAVRAKPGQVLKVTRNSPTAGEHIAYRYTVEG